jgi:hypothetical protein
MTSDTVVVPEWIKRIAEDERRRDAVRAGEEAAAAHKADLVRLNARRLVDELRATVARDLEAFGHEFEGDAARQITVDPTLPGDGFSIHSPAAPGVTLTVTPQLQTGALHCHYRFTSTNGLPPREDRVELVFAGDDRATVQLRHGGSGRIFATADALSEFLLVPVLTGRPR